jgi:hypothetical protein
MARMPKSEVPEWSPEFDLISRLQLKQPRRNESIRHPIEAKREAISLSR